MTSTMLDWQPRTLEAPDACFVRFSDQAAAEIVGYVQALAAANPKGRVDATTVNLTTCPTFMAEVEATRPVIDQHHHYAVFDRLPGLGDSLRLMALYTWVLGTALGEPMAQNVEGWRLIEVYDRGELRTIEAGARYHQTRQGSHLHNDAVNDVDPIDYLVLACGQPAMVGGESILVDARSVVSALEAFPEVLACLQEEFLFEKRGMSKDLEFFSSPIIRFTPEGEPLVRYFRVYIEKAHERAGTPLDARRLAALDVFDAVMDQAVVQTRVNLGQGQVLVSADDRFLHTRTSFVDAHEAHSIDALVERAPDVNRYMLRMWSRAVPTA